jgi:hypothetical protein
MTDNIELVFAPCAEAAITFISGARRSLHAAVCWFTHPDIYQALLERARAGLRVGLMLNYDHINFHPEGLNFEALDEAGAKVLGFTGPGLLHHKFAVADELRALSGSYNWTRGQHHDHLLLVNSSKAARQFTEAFERLRELCDPLAVLREKPPRQTSFQQLYQPTLWSARDLRRRVIAGANVWVAAFIAKAPEWWRRCSQEQRWRFQCGAIMRSYWEEHLVWEAGTFLEWRAAQKFGTSLRQLSAFCLRVRPGDLVIAVRPPDKVLALGLVSSELEFPSPSQGTISRFVPWLQWPEGLPSPDPALTASRSSIRSYRGSALRIIETLSAYRESAPTDMPVVRQF